METKPEILHHIAQELHVRLWTFSDVRERSPVTRLRCSQWTAFPGSVYPQINSSGWQHMWGARCLEVGHTGSSSCFAEREDYFSSLEKADTMPSCLTRFSPSWASCYWQLQGRQSKGDGWARSPPLPLRRGSRAGGVDTEPESITEAAPGCSPQHPWLLFSPRFRC